MLMLMLLLDALADSTDLLTLFILTNIFPASPFPFLPLTFTAAYLLDLRTLLGRL